MNSLQQNFPQFSQFSPIFPQEIQPEISTVLVAHLVLNAYITTMFDNLMNIANSWKVEENKSGPKIKDSLIKLANNQKDQVTEPFLKCLRLHSNIY